MQKHKIKSLLATLLTLCTMSSLTGCGAANTQFSLNTNTPIQEPDPALNNNTPISPPPLDDAHLLYQVLIAEIGYTQQNLNDAFILTLNAANQSHDERLYERSVIIALQARQTNSALDAARQWQAANPASRDANRYILDILLSTRQFDQIIPAAQAIIKLTPDEDRPEFITALGQYLAPYASRVESFYEDLLSPWLQDGNMEEQQAAWLSVAMVKLSASKLDEAYNAVANAHAINPDAIEPILGAIALIDPSVPQAEELVQNYLRGESANPLVRLSYVQSLLQQQRVYPAIQQLEIAIEHPETPPIAWFILGSLLMEVRQPEVGMQTLKTYLDKTQSDFSAETRNNRERAFLELAQAEVDLNRIDAAQQWLDQVTDPTLKTPALKSYMSMLVRSGHFDTALRIAEQLPVNSVEERTEKSLIQAQILMQAQRWHEAYDLLGAVNSTLASSPNEELLYLQAIAAEKLERFVQMESILRFLMTINPDNANTYNTLGYLLAERNERLDEAKALIEKALELDPENAMIIDSMGWVEYRLGNNEQALALLERAFSQYPDPEIAAHLGEVQWVSNQRDNALTTWKLGLLTDPGNQVIYNTLSRLNIPQATLDNLTLPEQVITQSNADSSDAAAHNAALYIEYLIANKQWQSLYNLLTPIVQSTQNPDLTRLQAYAALQLGMRQEALNQLRGIIENHPDNAMAYNDLGYMLLEDETKLAEAQMLIEKAFELAPQDPAVLDSKGWLEFKLGNTEAAIQWLQQAYELAPLSVEAGLHLGEALWQANRKAEAILVWREVRARHPNLPELQETLDRLNVTLPE